VFADTPTRVSGVGFIRAKESDRIGALASELTRAGIAVATDEDGFTVTPGSVRPTRFRTYDDHRMAMSLALLGLRAPGVEIENPGCVAKTYPDFFVDLASLR
jgi:3-phosphoshikimate 1-carboxyvinyltransferase